MNTEGQPVEIRIRGTFYEGQNSFVLQTGGVEIYRIGGLDLTTVLPAVLKVLSSEEPITPAKAPPSYKFEVHKVPKRTASPDVSLETFELKRDIDTEKMLSLVDFNALTDGSDKELGTAFRSWQYLIGLYNRSQTPPKSGTIRPNENRPLFRVERSRDKSGRIHAINAADLAKFVLNLRERLLDPSVQGTYSSMKYQIIPLYNFWHSVLKHHGFISPKVD